MRSPAFLPDFLFEPQWVWWIAILAFAAACIYVGKGRARKPIINAGLVIAAATILWITAAFIFETPGERLYAAHAAMAHAAENADAAAIAAFVAPDFRCPQLGIDPQTPLAGVIDPLLKSANITSVGITQYTVRRRGDHATTDITIVVQSRSEGLSKTTWELEWTDVPDSDWKMTRAQLRLYNDQSIPPDQAILKLAP